MNTNYRLMEDVISIQGLYDAYGEYGHGLIDIFQSALNSIGCSCAEKNWYSESYIYGCDTVAVRSAWPTCYDEYDDDTERLDVAKEFVRMHREELTQLVLKGLINQTMLEAEMKYEMDEEVCFPDRRVIEQECVKVVENLFNQLG